MAQAVRFYQTGGPEVLRLEEVAVGNPAGVKRVAVALTTQPGGAGMDSEAEKLTSLPTVVTVVAPRNMSPSP